MKKISIVIPAYNEEKRIGRTLEEYGAFFSKPEWNVEIIVVMNGCTDRTLEVVKEFELKYPIIRHLDFKSAGKGFAINMGFRSAKGDYIGFSDADGSTSAEEFSKLISHLINIKEDGIIASRWLKTSQVFPKQPILRRIASRCFNFIVKSMFGLWFSDTQAGAKLFKREAIIKILSSLNTTQWSFDIDLLYQMKREKFKIIEFPITWRDAEGSKVNIIKTSIKMFVSIVRLRLWYSPFRFVVKIYNHLPEWARIHHKI